MIELLKAGFTIGKEYPSVRATLSYSPSTDRFTLRVESPTNTITDGLVQRTLMDFGLTEVETQIKLDKKRQLVVQF